MFIVVVPPTVHAFKLLSRVLFMLHDLQRRGDEEAYVAKNGNAHWTVKVYRPCLIIYDTFIEITIPYYIRLSCQYHVKCQSIYRNYYEDLDYLLVNQQLCLPNCGLIRCSGMSGKKSIMTQTPVRTNAQPQA